MEEFVVAGEKYGSGNLERKYRFSAENGNLERIGRKRETVATSVKQFFKVTFYGMHQWGGGGGVRVRRWDPRSLSLYQI